VVQAAVAGDPVEPWTQVDLAVVRAHRPEGVDEDFLEHVFGILGRAQHLAAEAEQARLVAVDDGVERARVSISDKGDEPLIALQLEQR
jgi:hypothetical protein